VVAPTAILAMDVQLVKRSHLPSLCREGRPLFYRDFDFKNLTWI
jgi:hypothetical protein